MAAPHRSRRRSTPASGNFNKNHARRVRVSGLIPAVVYGAGQASIAVTVDPKIITRILYSESGHNTIFDLRIEQGETGKAMIVDWQNEPIKGKLLHIDLKRIAMDRAMRVSVPIQLTGTPAGVKTQGGVLEHILREVEIECLPGDIPDHLDVDVSELEINGVIHISDLPHAGNIKFLVPDDTTVANVVAVKEDAAVADAAAAAAAATPAEPVVAKKGKTDAAAATPAPDAKAGKK